MIDVIVIGGGIAGCCTAYYLAADGVAVMLLDEYEPNSQASGANAGGLHAQIPHQQFVEYGEAWATRFASMVPFCLESIRLWTKASGELGVDLEVERIGGLTAAHSTGQLMALEAKAGIERAAGLEIEVLDRATLRRVAPYIGNRMVGATLCPAEAKANPLVAATAFADAAVALGARVISGCPVSAISRRKQGYTIHTTQGDFISSRVVNAAGASAGRIAEFVGARYSIRAQPVQVGVTEPVISLISHLVCSASQPLTLKQTRAGTILIGGGWPSGIDQRGRPQVSIESLICNLAVAVDVVPSLRPVSLVRSWAGISNGTAESFPVIGELPGLPGFFMNCVPSLGFTGGPAGGRIIASLLQGREAPVGFDIRPFLPT